MIVVSRGRYVAVIDHDHGAAGAKLAWGIFGLIPLVPFLYVLTSGDLW
jgi:hypothetical protein